MKELTQEEYEKVRNFLYDLQKKDANFMWFLENFLLEVDYNCVWYYMDELNEVLKKFAPDDIVLMIEDGNFKSYHNFFRLDDYGNLESTNEKDYSEYIDNFLIDEILDNGDYEKFDDLVEFLESEKIILQDDED